MDPEVMMPMEWLEMENWLWLRAEHGLPTFNEINTQMSMYKFNYLNCLSYLYVWSLFFAGNQFNHIN